MRPSQDAINRCPTSSRHLPSRGEGAPLSSLSLWVVTPAPYISLAQDGDEYNSAGCHGSNPRAANSGKRLVSTRVTSSRAKKKRPLVRAFG